MKKYALLALLAMPITTFSMDPSKLTSVFSTNPDELHQEDNQEGTASVLDPPPLSYEIPTEGPLSYPFTFFTFSDQVAQQQIYQTERAELDELNKLVKLASKTIQYFKMAVEKDKYRGDRKLIKKLKKRKLHIARTASKKLIKFISEHYPEEED